MKKLSRRRKILLIILLIPGVLLFIFFLPEKKQQLHTAHFTFLYGHSIQTGKVQELAKALEENYPRISHALQTKPADNIQVNIYAQRWRYIKATGNFGASGNVEGTGKLHFVEQAWTENDNKKIAIHEFTHAVVLKFLIDREPAPLDAKQFDKQFSQLPVWLWESISCYEAGQFIEPSTLPYLSGGRYPGLPELNNRSRGGKIYSVGYTLIEFILQQYGQDKLLQLLAAYGNLAVLNQTEESFSRDWYAFIKEKYLH
jgi:hypothetical protein